MNYICIKLWIKVLVRYAWLHMDFIDKLIRPMKVDCWSPLHLLLLVRHWVIISLFIISETFIILQTFIIGPDALV